MFPKNILKKFWAPVISVRDIETPGLPSLFDGKVDAAKLPAVPLPQVYTICWTEPASTGNGATHFPPSDTSVVSVPDPQADPALYNAAIDTIRCSNDFFVKSGCGSGKKMENDHPTKEALYEFAQAFIDRFPDSNYPNPPDLRSLCVTDKDYHPVDKNVPWGSRLWVVACKRFEKLSVDEKVVLLRKTNAEQQQLYKRAFKDVNIYNDFLVEVFMKYLAHYEISERNKTAPQDVQPTEAELDAVFRAPETKDGITLYDLSHIFYNAAEPKELVRRVEFFANYVPNPSKQLGQDETPEGHYVRKAIPSTQQIEAAIATPLTLPELFETLARAHPEFSSGVGSQVQTLKRLMQIAAPDVTTGRWIKKDTLPTAAELEAVLADDEILSIEDILPAFPDRIASKPLFQALFEAVAAPDLSTGRWIKKDTLPTGEEIEAVLARYEIHSADHSIAAFPGKIASRPLFQALFDEIATRDLATRAYIARSTPCPSALRIHAAMMYLGGGPLSTGAIAEVFPRQVACEATFVQEIKKAAYPVGEEGGEEEEEEEDGEWAPRWRQADDTFLAPEFSKRLFGLEAQMKTDPLKVLAWVAMGDAHWDGNAYTEFAGEFAPEAESDEDALDSNAEGEGGVPVHAPASPDAGPSEVEGLAASPGEVTQHRPEVIDLTSPPGSPRRKRAAEDEGDEVSERSDGSSRSIKRARCKKEE